MKKIKNLSILIAVLIEISFFICISILFIILARFGEGVKQNIFDLLGLVFSSIVITILVKTGLLKEGSDKILFILNNIRI